MAKRGMEADPLSVPLSNDTADAYYLARRFDEALNQYWKTTEIDPNRRSTYLGIGMSYQQMGMHDEAIKAYQKAISGADRTSHVLAVLAYAYAASGRRAEAMKIRDELTTMAKEKYVSPYDLAVLYTGLGEKDQALEQLNKALDERAAWIMNLKVEPLFDPLHSEPRFADLVRRLELPQ